MQLIHFHSIDHSTHPEFPKYWCGAKRPFYRNDWSSYRDKITCKRCLARLDAQAGVLKARIDVLSKLLAAKRRMRGAK